MHLASSPNQKNLCRPSWHSPNLANILPHHRLSPLASERFRKLSHDRERPASTIWVQAMPAHSDSRLPWSTPYPLQRSRAHQISISMRIFTGYSVYLVHGNLHLPYVSAWQVFVTASALKLLSSKTVALFC